MQTLPLSTPFSSAGLSPSPLYPPIGGGLDVSTGFDDRGFPTTYTREYGWQTMPKSYDEQGFLITGAPTATAVGQGEETPCFGANCGNAGKVVGTSSSKAVGVQRGPAWGSAALLGAAAALFERLLL